MTTKKKTPSRQNGSLKITVIDGNANIVADLPFEETNNLTAYVADQYVRMLVYLQTMDFDHIINEAITKAGFKQGKEQLAKVIISSKESILYPEPDDEMPEGPERLDSDEAFEQPGDN